MLVLTLYLIGSFCFAAGTIISMLDTKGE